MPKLPRHKLAPLDASGAPDKSALRALLTKPPIAAYNIPKGREGPKLRNAVKEHWKAVKQQEEERFEALFALYDIPEDWDELTQWYTLARILAAERYQGLRTLMKAPGGPDGTRREKAYDLFREFEAYALAHPALTHSAAAKHFVKTRRKKNVPLLASPTIEVLHKRQLSSQPSIRRK
jgi:hypothetical protein